MSSGVDLNAVKRVFLQKNLFEFVKYFWDTFDGAELKTTWLMEYQAECFQYTVRHFLPDWVKSEWIDDDRYYFIKMKTGGSCPMRDHPDRNNHDWNMPPRHSKSTTHNVVGPVWLNTIRSAEIASVSHIQDLATDFNLKRQKIINSEKFKELFPSIEITKSTAKEINLKSGGKLFSVGMTNFTGFGADIIINDDIVSSEHAKKDKEVLANARSYFTNTLPTRRNQGEDSVVWNIMQRLAPGDISGMIETSEELSSKYTKTVIKAIAEDDNVVIFPCSGKVKKIKKGDYLWPKRFSDYSGVKALVGAGTFETQYQQNAINSELTYIKPHMINWITYDEFVAQYEGARQYGSFDFPVKGKDDSDKTGYVEGWKKLSKLALTSAFEERMGYTEQKRTVKSLHNSNPGIIQIYEDKANGSVLVQDLSQEVSGIVVFEPGTRSKGQRLDISSTYVENGNIDFVLGKDGKKPKDLVHLERVICNYPFVENDDLVDAFSQIVLYTYTDAELKIYGRQFDSNNIVNQYDIVGLPVDIAINKRGDVWKVQEVVQNYRRDEFCVINEYILRGKSEDVMTKLKDIKKGKRMMFDANVNSEVYNLLMGKFIVQPNYTNMEKSILSVRNGLVKNRIKIMSHCHETISDIETFRYSRESVDKREPKPITLNDGFAGCIRVVVTAAKGENAVFM